MFSQILTHWQSTDCHSLAGLAVYLWEAVFNICSDNSPAFCCGTSATKWWTMFYFFMTIYYCFQFSHYCTWQLLKNTWTSCLLFRVSYCMTTNSHAPRPRRRGNYVDLFSIESILGSNCWVVCDLHFVMDQSGYNSGNCQLIESELEASLSGSNVNPLYVCGGCDGHWKNRNGKNMAARL